MYYLTDRQTEIKKTNKQKKTDSNRQKTNNKQTDKHVSELNVIFCILFILCINYSVFTFFNIIHVGV